MPSLKLSNPFRRGADRPSLKQRAASLKATASRLMGRKPAEVGADQGRRMMVAGSMAVAVIAPLPALAAAAPPVTAADPHPDQSLFDAETAYRAAREAEAVAKATHNRVSAAYRAARGDLPASLRFPRWAICATAHPGMPLWQYRIEHRLADGFSDEVVWRWTAKGLRTAIAALPKAYGKAGTTPKLIRDLRALVPVAEAYEARKAELEKRFGTADVMAAWSEAQTATRQARNLIVEAVATTPPGLAVKVRQATEGDWRKADRAVGGLIQSAALVAGVALVDPDAGFDAAAWVRAWEGIGGKALKDRMGFSPNFHCPPGTSGEHAAALKAETTRLIAELEEHRDAIERHVKGRA